MVVFLVFFEVFFSIVYIILWSRERGNSGSKILVLFYFLVKESNSCYNQRGG